MWYSSIPIKDNDPTLCTIGREKALTLISKALDVVNKKAKKANDRYNKEYEETHKGVEVAFESKWTEHLNKIINERNGLTGNFFKRQYRKLLVFLHVIDFSTFTVFEEKMKEEKEERKADYVLHEMGDFCSYWDRRNDSYSSSDCLRLEKLRKAVELSETISLSIRDANIIYYYTQEKVNE